MPPHKTGSAEHLELERLLLCRLSVLTNRKSKAIVRDHSARFGLNVAEWRATAALRQFGPASVSEICAHNETDKGTVSRAANFLVSREMVRSRTDVNDRRTTIYALKRSGRVVHDRIAPIALAHEASLLGALSTHERDHCTVFWTSFSAKQTRAPSIRNAPSAAQSR